MADAIRDLVRNELAQPVDAKVTALARSIAERHPGSARAILFYGSCLREHRFDGLMLDFYLIVSGYRAAYTKRWLAAANRIIPPNVFFVEKDGLRAKYAVLSEADFERLNGPGTSNVSVWARFAQPSRLVWSSDAEAAERAVGAVARAAPSLLAAALPVITPTEDPLDLWREAFRLTYSAELRAEKKERGGSVVDTDADRYRRFTDPALVAIERPRRLTGWMRRRLEGKALSVIRLAKASATFAGGADYIVWKINRHAGTDFALKPWQRRHPLLAAITLLPRLIRSKAIR